MRGALQGMAGGGMDADTRAMMSVQTQIKGLGLEVGIQIRMLFFSWTTLVPLQSIVQKAVNPDGGGSSNSVVTSSGPSAAEQKKERDAQEARRKLKEQNYALQREKERQRAVEQVELC